MVARSHHAAHAPQVLQAVAIVKAAALAGQPCPTNSDMADMLGVLSPSKPATLLKAAETMGLIRVHRGVDKRVVEAVDGSWRTAGEIPKRQHWRVIGKDPTVVERPHRIRARAEGAKKPRITTKGAAWVARVALAPAAPPVVFRPPTRAIATPKQPAVITGGCKWPMWPNGERAPATPLYCNRVRRTLSCPYCADHAAVAYVTPYSRVPA